MRKLFYGLAIVAVTLAGFGAQTPSFSVDITCPANTTPEHLLLSQSSCDSACVAEKGSKKDGCKAACRNIHDVCLKRLQEAKKKEEEVFKKDMVCRGPVIDCLVACKKETKDLNKCGKCTHGEALTKFQHCLKS